MSLGARIIDLNAKLYPPMSFAPQTRAANAVGRFLSGDAWAFEAFFGTR